MECNRETLMLAMKYRGKYAKIHGIDNKGESFNENILCHIIKGMVIESIVKHPFGHYDTSKFPEVIDCFCEYVGDAPVERQEASVLQFLSDPALNDLLFKIFLEGDYMPVNGIRRDTHSLFIRLLTKQVFESGKLSELSKLPATFDYTPYIGGLTGILVNEAVQDTEAVAHWLTSHDVSSLLTLDETDFNTIPL